MNARTASLALLLGLLPACGPMHRADHESALTAEFALGSPLEVFTENGDVSVIVDPAIGALAVEAVAHGSGDSATEAKSRAEAIRIDVAVRDGRTVIRPVYPNDERRSGEGCSFKVRVAASSDIFVDSSNGELELVGSTGSARLETSNGAVHVRGHRGPLDVESSNGGLVLEDVEGEVIAETSNGSIALHAHGDLSQPVRLSSSNGDLTIHVAVPPAGMLRAETSNGTISVTGMEFSFTGDYESRARDVDFRRPGPRHVASTSNGSIRVQVGPR